MFVYIVASATQEAKAAVQSPKYSKNARFEQFVYSIYAYSNHFAFVLFNIWIGIEIYSGTIRVLEKSDLKTREMLIYFF